MNIPIFQIDAFASEVFAGNPAAACPLKEWLTDSQMQSIAAENNLSETAFFVERKGYYELRWFTPKTEVDLCGHATLATAYVIFNHINPSKESITFETKSGTLIVKRKGELLSMDFPTWEAVPCKAPAELLNGLEIEPVEVLSSVDYMAVYDSEDEIRSIQPNMDFLKDLSRGVIVTSVGNNCDFVSRFFAPAVGIPEDPVTGSAHCTLVPYWSKRLGKRELHARQVSARGGELFCKYLGDRVIISGRAVKYLEGTIYV